MSGQNIQGVDLASGKLSLPISLASVSGPNKFGETLSLQYSTDGLLPEIKTWNEEAQTSEVGLGWSLSQQYIMRNGNGSLDDSFILNGDQVLTLQSKTQDPNSGIYALVFVTSQLSLTKIVYETIPNDPSSPEKWTIVDANGVIYTYGGNPAAVALGVRWIAPTTGRNGQPLVWSGDSIEKDNQSHYALAWYLSSKENIYSQRVEYDYFSVTYNVGENGAGLHYTVGTYLQGIRVVNGGSLALHYADKNTWETPALRIIYPSSGGITNAYQDRLATKYLQSVSIYNTQGNLQSVVELDYHFLFKHYPTLSGASHLSRMQKRVLTVINYLTPDGKEVVPAQLFDYWGLHEQIVGANITSTNLFTLIDSDLSGTFTYTDSYQKSHTYHALFGHMKTQTGSQGAVTWYSYQEVSKNYDAVQWPTSSQWNKAYAYSWPASWQNRLNTDAMSTPDGSKNWFNPLVYWGADNYAVITWESNESNDFATIALKIYEWLGYWVEVQVSNCSMMFTRPYYAGACQLMTDQGKFVLCRSDVNGDANGLITLFHRDPYLPGLWHSTPQLTQASDVLQYIDDTSLVTNYQQLEINIGTNVVSVLDKLGDTLYLYSLVNNQWSAYVIPVADNSGVAVQGNEICVITAKCTSQVETAYTYQLDYTIYKFDPTQTESSAWKTSTGLYNGNPQTYSSELEGINIGLMESGIFLVQILVKPENSTEAYTLYPIALSWNTDSANSDDWEVNLQKIYYDNGDASVGALWGFGAESEGILWVPSYYGSISASNLINIIPEDSGDFELFRNVTRYVGGSTPIDKTSYNTGWIEDINFAKLTNNSDSWSQMAIFDNVIEDVGSGDSCTYNFYQYTAYGNSTDSKNHPYWSVQGDVGTAMGTFKNWEQIDTTVGEVFGLAGALIKGIFRWLPGGRIVIATDNAVTKITKRILKKVSQKAMSGRSGSIVQGMNYLLVGQGGIANYTNIDSDDPPSSDPVAAYQPSAFAKIWDTTSACWKWQSLGSTLTTMAQKNAVMPSTWGFVGGKGDDHDYDDFIMSFLGQEVYTYSNSFIPFSYMMYGGKDVGHDNIRDSYLRGFYFDQVAFFQNGTVCCSQLLPTWNTGEITRSGRTYDSVPLPYLVYTGTDVSPPLMFAPWGGIFAYQPGYLNVVYDPGSDITQDWAWESNLEGNYLKDANVTPELSLASNVILTMALNNAVEGNVTDYVVSQIAVDDAYQTYNTFFQYMPWFAAGQADGSVVYNQVRTSMGGTDYAAAAMANGWSEYYFYNGGVSYSGSLITSSTLPYDPACGSDDFSKTNQALVNTGQYYNLMTESLYCQRTLMSQGSGDFSQGYEVARQQTFYQGFDKFVSDDSSGTLITTQQQVTGVLPTLTVSYSAPANTTSEDITVAYTQGAATLQSSYYFYDMAYTDRNSKAQNLYGPLSPADSSTPYQLGLNSGLALGKLVFNYHQTEVQGALAIEAGYTQTIPGFYVPQLDDTASAYQRFSQLNLYNVNVQTISWYHPDLVTAPNTNFATPTTAWGTPNNQDWQIVASQITAWEVARDSQGNASCWCPKAKYTWQGDSQGNPQTASFSGSNAFPWSAPPVNSDNTPWLQQSMTPNAVTASGVLLASETATTLPTYTTYDSSLRLPLMKVTNAGLPGTSFAFYTSFETYEDMSSWHYSSTPSGSNTPTTLAISYSPSSYAGNRSAMLNASAGTTYLFAINLPNAVPSQKTWLVGANIMVDATAANNSLNLSIIISYENNQTASIYNESFTALNGWVSYSLPINVDAYSGITGLAICMQLSDTANLYVDSLYCVPAQESKFTCISYDLANLSPIASASAQDPGFCTRALKDNRGRPIGSIRKTTQSAYNTQWLGQPEVAATISLNTNYLSREGGKNNDSFTQIDPNFAVQVVGGANQPIAGYYFDFRDGLNPWSGGNVPTYARSLCLDINQSTSYPIPPNMNWGIGLRAQIQGYIESGQSLTLSANAVVSTPKALALPTSTVSDCFHLYGVYSDAGANPSTMYGFELSFDASSTNTITESTTASISNSTAVMNGPQLLTCNPAGDLMFGVFESNNQYSLYEGSSQEIYSSTTQLYPPLAGCNNIVYYADEATALYGVDVTNCVNRTKSTFNPTAVVSYSDILPNATCPMAPVMDANHTSIAWLLTTASPHSATSKALSFAAGQGSYAYGQVIDKANVLNFDYDQDFTIECWIQSEFNTPQNGLISLISKWNMRLSNGKYQPYPYMVRMDANGYVQGARYDGEAHNPIASSTTKINDGNFHHIAFVRQTDVTGQGWLYLYVDGNLENTLIDTVKTSTQNDANLMLNKQFFTQQTQEIQLIELRIWNYARTSDQIKINMSHKLTGYEGGLVSYWTLNGNGVDRSPYKQNIEFIKGTSDYQYPSLPSANQLPAPSSAWVKYDIASNSVAVWVISNATMSLPTVATVPSLSTDGGLFVTTPSSVCAYDKQLGYVSQFGYSGKLAGPPVTGNHYVLVAFTTGMLTIYDENLNEMISINTGLTLNTEPVIHGNKFSVVGQTASGIWTIQTYTMAGVLVTQPYVVDNVQSSVSIQAFSSNVSSLCVMVDNTTFSRLDFGVPIGTSMTLGDYKVLYTQDSTTSNYQYQLQNNGAVLATVDLQAMNAAIGDWWLMVIENTLYFYADGEQIFAYALSDTSLPSGNFALSAGSNGGISCRDIVVCLEPSFTMQFSDGAGKVRQTQTLATLAAPQS